MPVREHATMVARQAQMDKDPTDGQAPYLEEFRKEIDRYLDLAQEVSLRTPREGFFWGGLFLPFSFGSLTPPFSCSLVQLTSTCSP